MFDISKYLRSYTKIDSVVHYYGMAHLTRDHHTIFDDNLGFFQRLFSVTDEMKLPPLQKRIIIMAIFRMVTRVLPDHMNIPM